VSTHGAVTARSSRVRQRGDVLDDDAVGAGRRQGVAGEHRWGPGGGAGKEERRRGSPRRSCDGAAVGSGQRGGVLVGGRLRRGGGVLGAVLRLAVEAGKVVVAAASERDKKHDAGEKSGRQRAAAPF
jgi:hypothetical protein